MDFQEALLLGEIENILIVGDSIGDGNGADYWVVDQQRRKENGCRCIFDDGVSLFYETTAETRGWVYWLKQYLQSTFGAEKVPQVTNASIGGKSAKWENANKENWITQEYDVIILALGMNDRWDCESIEEFIINYAELCEYAADKCEYFVVLTLVPAIQDYNFDSYRMELWAVNDAIKLVCKEKGYQYVDLYEDIIQYSMNSGKSLDEFFFGGVHPNNVGYLTMWRMIAMGLDLSLPVNQVYDERNVLNVVADLGVDSVAPDMPIDALDDGNPVFREGVSVCAIMQDNFCLNITYPETLVIYRYSNGYGKQIFKPFFSEKNYIRSYEPEKGWHEWQAKER